MKLSNIVCIGASAGGLEALELFFINMPSDTTPDQLSKLLLEYIHDLKGVTVYVDGSRKGQVLNKVSEEEVLEYLAQGKEKQEADLETVSCPTGKCEL